MNNLSIVIVTKNEEKNIATCLDSLGWAKEIIIVDDFSQDKTKEIVSKYPQVKFYENKFINMSQQRNFANSKTTYNWILTIDADEVVSQELKEEILQVVEKDDFTAYNIPTKSFFWGRWLRYGGWYPDYHIRLFERNFGFWEKEVHAEVRTKGKIGFINYPIIHYGHPSFGVSLRKIKLYASREAEALISEGIRFKLYELFLTPAVEFINRFFIKKGFLDGFYGLATSLLMVYYRLLIQIKVIQERKKDVKNFT